MLTLTTDAGSAGPLPAVPAAVLLCLHHTPHSLLLVTLTLHGDTHIVTNGPINRDTDRQTDRQRQRDNETETESDRDRDRQIDRTDR